MLDLCVAADATIEDAMQAIGRGAVEIALVIDEQRHLLGTVTDGDVRRALLDSASLEDLVLPYANRAFRSTDAGTDRAWALDLMVANGIAQLPILSPEGRLIGLHVMREIVGGAPRAEPAVIMAGGRGTRLRPITESIPKPMVRVAGRPILERIVLNLVGAGVTQIFLAVNYHADQIEEHFGTGEGLGCRIDYLHEETERPQGTAGALSLLPPHVRDAADAVLVMNGDVISGFDPVALLEHHRHSRHLMTVGASSYAHDVPFGVLATDEDRLLGVEEKPRQTWQISAGVNVVSPQAIGMVPPGVRYDMTQLIDRCLSEGTVGVHHLDDDWIDVGRHNDLAAARGQR